MSSAANCIRIRDVEHLIELCDEGAMDFILTLNGGVFSRKEITWDNRRFHIWNGIDGSNDRYSLNDLEQSFIGEAIRAGALFLEL